MNLVNEVVEGLLINFIYRDLGLGYVNNGVENDIGYDNVFEMFFCFFLVIFLEL